MSNIITTREFAISKEIVAQKTDGGERQLINEQSEENVELVDLEMWLATYLDPSIVYSNIIENATIMGEPTDEECQSFFDTLRALLMAGKIQNIITENFRSYTAILEGQVIQDNSGVTPAISGFSTRITALKLNKQ